MKNWFCYIIIRIQKVHILSPGFLDSQIPAGCHAPFSFFWENHGNPLVLKNPLRYSLFPAIWQQEEKK